MEFWSFLFCRWCDENTDLHAFIIQMSETLIILIFDNQNQKIKNPSTSVKFRITIFSLRHSSGKESFGSIFTRKTQNYHNKLWSLHQKALNLVNIVAKPLIELDRLTERWFRGICAWISAQLKKKFPIFSRKLLKYGISKSLVKICLLLKRSSNIAQKCESYMKFASRIFYASVKARTPFY